MDGKAFSTIIIHYSQAPEPTAVVQLVRDKIHAPTFVQIGGVTLFGLSMCG